MKDSEKLRILADWFDFYDRKLTVKNDEVQQDLRRIADKLESKPERVVVAGEGLHLVVKRKEESKPERVSAVDVFKEHYKGTIPFDENIAINVNVIFTMMEEYARQSLSLPSDEEITKGADEHFGDQLQDNAVSTMGVPSFYFGAKWAISETLKNNW